MKEYYQRHFQQSLQNKIYVSFILLMILVTVLLSMSSYFISVEILKKKVSDSFMETITYVSNSIEKELEQVEQISDFIFANNQMKQALIKDYTNKGQYLSDMMNIDEVFINYSVSDIFQYIPGIKVFGKNGVEISYGNKVYEVDSYVIKSLWDRLENVQNKGSIRWNGVHSNYTLMKSEIPYVISLFRLMRNEDYTKDIGLMYISLDPAIFSDMLNKVHMSHQSEIIIVDHQGKIVYHPDAALLSKDISQVIGGQEELKLSENFIIGKGKHKKMMICKEIESYHWKVLGTIPLKTLIEDNKAIIQLIMPIFFVISIFASMIWYLVLSRMIKPIKVLSKTMNSVREGNTMVRVECKGDDEIAMLGKSFNYMIERIHKLFNGLLEEQYKTLRAQINPHFLYNTLNSIRWMAIIQKADNIKEVIDVLSRLLMNSTKNADQFITIEEELNNLQDYIYIQKIRYNHSFEVKFNIQKEALPCLCIKLMLQPLVENAIFHGIEPKGEFGIILVSIHKKGDLLGIQIEDNGVGMEEEQIEEILHHQKEKKRGFSGIGVRNVHERIRMLYGGEYGIQITSKKGEYTRIEMTIPAHTEDTFVEKEFKLKGY